MEPDAAPECWCGVVFKTQDHHASAFGISSGICGNSETENGKAESFMKILCIGDVVGTAGCRHLRQVLPGIKKLYGIDVCIVNGENSADGNGITPAAADHILDLSLIHISWARHGPCTDNSDWHQKRKTRFR